MVSKFLDNFRTLVSQPNTVVVATPRQALSGFLQLPWVPSLSFFRYAVRRTLDRHHDFAKFVFEALVHRVRPLMPNSIKARGIQS